MLERWFSEHPRSVGETYVEHLKVAASFGISMIAGGLACLVHALLPSLFRTKASQTVARLHERMVVSRARRPPVATAAKRLRFSPSNLRPRLGLSGLPAKGLSRGSVFPL